MANRFIDWLTNLTAKSTTIDGTEITHIGSSGLSQKSTLSDVIRYGGGNSTRVTTIGNANIHQKSDGTMWLEVTGQTAGNARGAGAFDWQTVRSAATSVASGANSFVVGAYNAGSGARAFVAGSGCNVSGFAAAAFGTAAVSTNTNQFSVGASSVGQASIQPLVATTTDASATALNTSSTATDRMVIPATRSCAFIGIVQAMCNVSSSSNFIKAWKIEGVITRDGNNTTRIVGAPTITVMAQDTDGTQTPSTWAIASITADDTNEALAINVTGQTGQTIRWQAVLMYSQVGF